MKLAEREFDIVEVIYLSGPCNAEEILNRLGDAGLMETMQCLHDLVHKGILLRPEIDEQMLYEVNDEYEAIRQKLIQERWVPQEF